MIHFKIALKVFKTKILKQKNLYSIFKVIYKNYIYILIYVLKEDNKYCKLISSNK